MTLLQKRVNESYKAKFTSYMLLWQFPLLSTPSVFMRNFFKTCLKQSYKVDLYKTVIQIRLIGITTWYELPGIKMSNQIYSVLHAERIVRTGGGDRSKLGQGFFHSKFNYVVVLKLIHKVTWIATSLTWKAKRKEKIYRESKIPLLQMVWSVKIRLTTDFL